MTTATTAFTVRSYFCMIDSGQLDLLGHFAAPGYRLHIVVNGLALFRVVDSRIVEFWRKDDDVSLLMQLGAMPAPA